VEPRQGVPAGAQGGRHTGQRAPGQRPEARGQRPEARGQDDLPAIDTDGEIDAVFFAGEFSRAVLQKPALQAGEGVVDRPWERMARSGLTTPSTEQSAMAKLTMAVVSQRLGGHLRTPELPSSTGSPANPSSSRSN